jgi:GPH family glycoside/pentoside/hexuronide:cation symporter
MMPLRIRLWAHYRQIQNQTWTIPALFLFLSIPFGISVFLTFTTPDLAYASKLFMRYCTYILVNLMFTTVTIPYISFISVLTSDPKEKLSANGYRLFFAKVAALLVSSVVPIMAKSLGENTLHEVTKFRWGLWP